MRLLMIDRGVFPIRRRKHARPRELLAAARDLFVERGFAATRTGEIAERAGVSKGTLYVYFDTKENLFTEPCASPRRPARAGHPGQSDGRTDCVRVKPRLQRTG